MRTSNFVKLFAHILLGAGIILAIHFLSPRSLVFWFVILGSVASWLVLRLLAIAGQLIFEIRHDFGRMLSNMERSGQYSNTLQQEIRDILDDNKGTMNA